MAEDQRSCARLGRARRGQFNLGGAELGQEGSVTERDLEEPLFVGLGRKRYCGGLQRRASRLQALKFGFRRLPSLASIGRKLTCSEHARNRHHGHLARRQHNA